MRLDPLRVVLVSKIDVVTPDELARRFGAALEVAAKTGNREAIYDYLAPDVEWVTPKRSLRGIEEIKTQLTWLVAPEHLDREFGVVNWEDIGDGRFVCRVHEVYRVKGSGDFAYHRDREIDVTIRDDRVSRYEMRIVG